MGIDSPESDQLKYLHGILECQANDSLVEIVQSNILTWGITIFSWISP